MSRWTIALPLLSLALAQAGQGSILSNLSPADRDVAAKVLLSSLGDLRAFYARQPRGSTLWLFVPEVSVWTHTLAQEFEAQGGQVRFVVPEGTARTYCRLYRSDSRFHVMPRDTLPKEQSFAVIYPPAGATQKGAVMAGRYLVDRPDWRETDYLSFATPLSPTQEGLPEAQAYVWGSISQANLKARVWFKDWTLDSYENYWTGINFGFDWNGQFEAVVGRGSESFTLEGWTPGAIWFGTRNFSVRDREGRYRGYAYVYLALPTYTGSAYLRGWSQTTRYATDNDRPVEAGGYVTAEGQRYRIPGLEGYLLPTGKDLEAAEGDPYVSYITRSISPDQAPFGGTGRPEAKVWFKPLSEWCRERGL
ncbi:hypothetical protein [Thermus islandicus]|uniref:hypothetical protein n=1 Tax=Thermus islandicus TaxID=540988 RepID=UPI0003B36E33|nr:hypothetical protein [Thermus islandicus]